MAASSYPHFQKGTTPHAPPSPPAPPSTPASSIMRSASSSTATAHALALLLDACRNGDSVLVWQMLLSPTGAVSVDAVGMEGEIPLIVAAKHGHPRLANALLGLGASVDAKGANGQTALYFAASHNRVGVAAVLLNHSANVDAGDVAGWMPLCVVAYRGHEHVVSLLLKHRADVNAETAIALTSLYLAAQNNQVGVVAALLIHQAKVDVANRDGVTPLYIAAYNGHILVVSVLLACGASVDVVNKNGVSPLSTAAQHGRAKVVAELLKHCANVDLADRDGVTPLYFAAQNGHADVASLLLLKHPATDSLRAVAVNGWTPLHVAACSGYVNVVSALLTHRVNVDVAELVGDTPPHLAAERGHVDVVALLLKKHANINAANAKGNTPLHGAAFQGHVEVLRLLLKHHANVDVVNVIGATPLYVTAQNARVDMMSALIDRSANGNLDVVNLLLERQAHVDAANANGATPLYIASQHNRKQVVTALLARQANVNAAQVDGLTPLFVASQNGHANIVAVLLKYHAHVNAEPVSRVSSLFIACQNGHMDVVAALLKNQAKVDAADVNGTTPLATAAQNGHVKVVSLLLKHRASVEAANVNGAIPLYVAAWCGHRDVAVVLLSHQASADAVEEKRLTPLHFAAAQGHDAVVTLLLKHMANVDVSSVNGRTPLHMATKSGHVKVMATLLAHGANVDAVTVDGSTPLHIAACCGRIEVVTLLASSCNSTLEVTDAQGNTSIMVAARSGQFDVMKLLIGMGASVHVRAADGETVLVSAARWRNLSTITLLFDLGHLSPKRTADGQKSLLSASIQTLEYQEHTFEFQQLWARVADRVMDIYGRLAESSDSTQDSNYQLIMVVFHFVRLRKVCSSRSVFVRLAASDTIATRFRDLHTDLTVLEQGPNSSSFDSTHADWEAQHIKDELALLKILRGKVEGATAIEFNQESKETQVKVASLLQHKMRVHSDKCSPDLLNLVELSLRKVREASTVALPAVPDWFIPSQELDADQVGKVSGSTTRTPPVRGMWINSAVMVSQHRVARSKFVESVKKCRSLSHPNVVEVFGASHLQSPSMAVFENVLSTSLREYLSRHENKHMLWQKLFEVSLGLKYLYERGITLEHLRCDDIWVGTNGAAKINAFVCILPVEDSDDSEQYERWQAPEKLRGEVASIASSVFALGMCVLEAWTGKAPWEDNSNSAWKGSVASKIKRGFLPELPQGMTSEQKTILEGMWLTDPSKRMTISSVVLRLKNFAGEQISKLRSHGKTKAAKIQPYDIQRFEFSGLESTIPGFLDKLEWRCEYYSESKEAVQHILRRARDVYGLLQTQHRLPSDIIIMSYREVLLSLKKFLRNASHENSVLLRAKSQKVVLQSNVFHRRLDEFLELLSPQTVGPIHLWTKRLDEDGEPRSSKLESASIEDIPGSPEQDPATSGARVVKIVRFKADRLNERFKELDFKAIEAATKSDDAFRPPWLVHTYDLRYEEKDKIGEGAFGEVYKARWLGTSVVVKFVGYEMDGDVYSRELFFHELRVWFPLGHPHVIKLFGACHTGKRFFVCEHADNGTLDEYLKQDVKADKSWHLLHQVALGLQYLHKQNILHNDLKCDNVLISADSDAKVIDFGLSSILHSAEIQVVSKEQGAQQRKSSEYIRGDRPTLASDIYSFGMLILEATTGESPRGGLTDAAVRFQVKKGNLPQQSKCLSGSQWNLVKMMCASDPSHRVNIAYVVDKLHEFWQQQQGPEQKKREIGIYTSVNRGVYADRICALSLVMSLNDVSLFDITSRMLVILGTSAALALAEESAGALKTKVPRALEYTIRCITSGPIVLPLCNLQKYELALESAAITDVSLLFVRNLP